MRVSAQRKTNAYKQTYADNLNISFVPAIMSTSNRMHGEFLRLLFLQAHRETEAHFTAAGCHRDAINRNHFGSSARHSTNA
jgi:recombinational DNA repair ATPase RecF